MADCEIPRFEAEREKISFHFVGFVLANSSLAVYCQEIGGKFGVKRENISFHFVGSKPSEYIWLATQMLKPTYNFSGDNAKSFGRLSKA